ncbi:MAG: hypothetical protein FRX48_07509 [Lasallia pustulata]|uniref:TLC domain-containing protein n=1 Tax=Lasallia pustulata TaxID=136370 RepID=A0A5M8PGE7_9LECA|nr:MAG: hypothetical protein FRX48_07509 [Lasallia pustulata]
MSSTTLELEPFPNLSPRERLKPDNATAPRPKDKMPRPHRRSSGLGADIRGDTSGPAVSTLNTTPTIESPPTPRPSHSLPHAPPPAPQTPHALPPLASPLVPAHMGQPAAADDARGGRLRRAPFPRQPAARRALPLLRAAGGVAADPRARPPCGAPTHYAKGPRDLAFVAFYVVVLSFSREFLMQRVVRPLARRCGIRGRAKQARFMEQVYTAGYFAVFGPYGVWVMRRTPVWYFDAGGMFEGFPHRAHEGAFKAYYLLQASYWAQQAVVLMLQLEKPRKDFRELVGHHVVTLALIGLSYRFHFTYMGLAVYITHDVSDFFLATSKILNYLDSPFVVPYFSLFIAIWIYLRHYLNLCILYATLTKFATVGPYVLDWETQQYKCWISQVITFVLLASLQSINLFWLFLIGRIAYNIVFRSAVEDVRSDNEEEEEVEMVEGGVGAGVAAAKGLRQRQVEDEGQGQGNVEWDANGAALVGENGTVVGDGDGMAEKLDEYVDVGREEKKDR